jgi:hypothetical protein
VLQQQDVCYIIAAAAAVALLYVQRAGKVESSIK